MTTQSQIAINGSAKLAKWLLRGSAAVGFVIALSVGVADVQAQVAGSSTIGVSQEEIKAVAVGWSVKRNVLDKSVYNDKKEKLGEIEDLIITPERAVSYAIVGVGGFLGIGEHRVAIPMSQLKADGDRFVLPGATKDALKAMPKFEYAKVERKK